MNLQRAIMANIVENPDDDLPRLVYADWLEEQGDPRAEFIRVQCELAKLDEGDARRAALFEREAELLGEYYFQWAGEVEGLPRYYGDLKFRRGLLAELVLNATVFVLQKTQRVLQKELPRVGCDELELVGATKKIKQLAGAESLEWFPTVVWRHGQMAPEDWKLFFRSSHLARVSRLDMRDCFLCDKAIGPLRNPCCVPHLKRLHLRNNHRGTNFTASMVAEILRNRPLETLVLETHQGHGLLPDSGAGFQLKQLLQEAGEALSSVRELRLLGGYAVSFAELASCPHLTGLEHLDFSSTLPQVNDNTMARMLDNPALANLKRFDFGQGGVVGEPAAYSSMMLDKLRERFPGRQYPVYRKR